MISSGYSFISATGVKKKHGCVIAYQNTIFRLIRKITLYYDDHSAFPNDFSYQKDNIKTKNIALLAAFEEIGSGRPLIVATTHLFWHPEYDACMSEVGWRADILLEVYF